jgi:hypothetical protein
MSVVSLRPKSANKPRYRQVDYCDLPTEIKEIVEAAYYRNFGHISILPQVLYYPNSDGVKAGYCCVTSSGQWWMLVPQS